MLQERCRQAHGKVPASTISTLSVPQSIYVAYADDRQAQRTLASTANLATSLGLRPRKSRPCSLPCPAFCCKSISSLRGPSAFRDLRARESPRHCQQRYIAVLLKEITIDPTALLPMLFAKDSRASWAPTRLDCSCTRWPDQHPLAAARPRETRL